MITHVCGFYYFPINQSWERSRHYLPQLSLTAHTKIVASTSRTILTQTFQNPSGEAIPELRYTFPLYDGVSVVDFVCTVNHDRVIRGVVKERTEAKQTYDAAVKRGEVAGLLEQLPDASDVFTTTIGNVPAKATLKVEITYLGELKHDAEADGIRFTIPTSISPRYGDYPGTVLESSVVDTKGGMSIIVDAEMPVGCNIKSVQSPSHPISVTIGNTAEGAAAGADMSLQKASATLSLGTTALEKDFVLHVVATNTGDPIAVLETHPTLEGHRALMATLVPKFNLPSSHPEIVFICDRSGSMGDGRKIPNLQAALRIFLKSVPVGAKFNICSFGSSFEFLFKNGSESYDATTLEKAIAYVDRFDANFGGTDIYKPMEAVFKKRYSDMNLEVFLLTDGEIWDQNALFSMINKAIPESKGAIRVFTLGIGSGVSHSLIEGVARAGNGFAQSVGDYENMNSKVVRMLKASLTPHITDYSLEIKYGHDEDDDFEMVEKIADNLVVQTTDAKGTESPPGKSGEIKPGFRQKVISLFDRSADPDAEMKDPSLDQAAGGKYAHVPTVSEPKLLQAPFEIPPLYSFSRTSVYVLLSPGSAPGTPKSVVLRGTSQYGPLELEIPVTVLTEKGQTIHQLAARKAIKELEEGRGWIFHARDSEDTSKLLKDKHQGRFSDMVEREAVRLGVKFQVGGKWCSFVAVEAKGDKASGEEEPPLPPYTEEEGVNEMLVASKRMVKSRAPSAGGLFGARVKVSASRCQARIAAPLQLQRQQHGGSLFGSAAPPPPPAPMAMTSERSSHSISGGGGRGGSALMAYSAMPPGASAMPTGAPVMRHRVYESAIEDADAGEDVGFGLFDDYAAVACADLSKEESSQSEEEGVATKRRAPPSVTSSVQKRKGAKKDLSPQPVLSADPLEALVHLQTFDGSWSWGSPVLRVLGLDLAAGSKAEAAGLDKEGDVLATALVLAFLETRLSSKKDEWEMLADKARDWMRTQLKGGLSVEEYIAKAKALL